MRTSWVDVISPVRGEVVKFGWGICGPDCSYLGAFCNQKRFRCLSSKLIEAEPELVRLAVSEQILPANFALLQAGHAAQHAAQRSVYAVGNLIVRRAVT